MSQPVALYQPPVLPRSQPVALYQQALLQPSQPITPYQQAVQPPRPVGRGGATQSASSATAPTSGQPVQECGRQLTRGRGLQGRLASHPGHGCGLTAGTPMTDTCKRLNTGLQTTNYANYFILVFCKQLNTGFLI